MTSQQSQNLEASTPDIARQGLSLETGPSRANASTHPDPSRVWTPVVVRCIASFLPPNEVACSLRLVDSATAAQFAAPAHATVTLSQPVPHHAFAAHWTRPDAFAALSRLDRQVLLRNTARSGCVDNLCLALDLIPDWNVNVDLVLDAATGGSLACAQLAKERGHVVIGHPSLKAAARAGSRELCEWLLRERLAHDRRALPGWAARGGHEALMEHFITATANCCDAVGGPGGGWLYGRSRWEVMGLANLPYGIVARVANGWILWPLGGCLLRVAAATATQHRQISAAADIPRAPPPSYPLLSYPLVLPPCLLT